MRLTRSTGPGFTLIELLVVIGIIALLIAILIPVLRKARMASQRTQCQSNVRQLYIGVLNYCNENHDWYPTCSYPADGTAYVEYPDDWLWWNADRDVDQSPIAKCLKVRGEPLKTVLRCPADIFDDRMPLSILSPKRKISNGPYLYSYGINSGVGINEGSGGLAQRTKRNQWHRPAGKILFCEDLNRMPTNYAQAAWDWTFQLTRRHGSGISKKTHKVMGINVTAGFMDGHVSLVDEDFATDRSNSCP